VTVGGHDTADETAPGVETDDPGGEVGDRLDADDLVDGSGTAGDDTAADGTAADEGAEPRAGDDGTPSQADDDTDGTERSQAEDAAPADGRRAGGSSTRHDRWVGIGVTAALVLPLVVALVALRTPRWYPRWTSPRSRCGCATCSRRTPRRSGSADASSASTTRRAPTPGR